MDARAEEGRVRYKPDVLEQLWRHGVHPRPSTDPRLVHEFVSDLYRYELRRLRDRLVRGEIAKRAYAATVVELRRRYPLISLKAGEWVEPGAVRSPPAGGAIIEP
jgi:hypothetical protein